ncbi:MAG TPA: HDOD domain-containing protein [Burkholderiaceae bacterium]|nr:HDOD domain-containing protein [Burkholderiaceae bacterium]
MTPWFWRLMPTRRTSPPPRAPVPARRGQAVVAESDAPPEFAAVDWTSECARGDLPFLAWMLEWPVDESVPIDARERAALRLLDRLAADPDAHAHLLPRAAAVVPALLARLRDPSTSLSELSQRVSRDFNLVAEVIRVANSARYRRDSAVVELGHAIQLLGVEGLRQTIARVVLKPLIDARGGELAARSASRLWEHTNMKSQLCAAWARDGGIDPFDAFVLALAHNAAWSVTLRALDTLGGPRAWHLGHALAQALAQRRDRLLTAIARQWQLPGSVMQTATEVGLRGPIADASMPVMHLYAGDLLASSLCIPAQAGNAAPDPAPASTLRTAAGPSVRGCLLAFASSRDARPG